MYFLFIPVTANYLVIIQVEIPDYTVLLQQNAITRELLSVWRNRMSVKRYYTSLAFVHLLNLINSNPQHLIPYSYRISSYVYIVCILYTHTK